MSGSGRNAAQCYSAAAASLPLLSLQRTVPRTKLEMGIFTNPSGVPEPGPPPKKETVRVELSGCGFLVKYCNVMFDIMSFDIDCSSVVKWLDLLLRPVLNVMQVSGPKCQLQQKLLVFF